MVSKKEFMSGILITILYMLLVFGPLSIGI